MGKLLGEADDDAGEATCRIGEDAVSRSVEGVDVPSVLVDQTRRGYEMNYRRKHALKFGILVHLRLYSSKQWDVLCSHFKLDGDTEIQAILKDLRRRNYIGVDTNQVVTITASGRRHLEEQFGQNGEA